MTQRINQIAEFQKIRSQISESLGFVPTMGALHQGHASLIERCKSENKVTVLSVFVNPTQFNNPDDLKNYPKTLESDMALAASMKVDYVFCPDYQQLYPDDFKFQIVEKDLSEKFCGKYRPGHFSGMLTVVMKLLQIVQPTRAYFGEKDFQQLQLIQKMRDAFFLPTEIIQVPTVREKDGLAMSSRNTRLTDQERSIAPKLYQVLTQEKNREVAIQKLEASGFSVEYIEDYKNRRLAAVYLGKVRLIDNVPTT